MTAHALRRAIRAAHAARPPTATRNSRPRGSEPSVLQANDDHWPRESPGTCCWSRHQIDAADEERALRELSPDSWLWCLKRDLVLPSLITWICVRVTGAFNCHQQGGGGCTDSAVNARDPAATVPEDASTEPRYTRWRRACRGESLLSRPSMMTSWSVAEWQALTEWVRGMDFCFVIEAAGQENIAYIIIAAVSVAPSMSRTSDIFFFPSEGNKYY